jgi:DNA invertase Pin-like site-specific DNA recombinase
MATVYSSIRFSSKRQEQGDSVRRQIAKGDAWLARHPEHTLSSTRLQDFAKSGFHGVNLDPQKGDLGKFIELARAGKIERGSILMVENVDRFSRLPTRKAYSIFCELVELGVSVLTLEPEMMVTEKNVDDMASVLTIIVQMQLAHEESKKKSLRSIANQEQKHQAAIEEKKPMGKTCPPWLHLVNGRYEKIPARVKILREIFAMSADGLGGTRIATKLNQAKVEGWGKGKQSGKGWNDAYINFLLRSKAPIGTFEQRKAGKVVLTIPGYYPSVLKETDWHKARKQSATRQTHIGPRGQLVRSSNCDCTSTNARCDKSPSVSA